MKARIPATLPALAALCLLSAPLEAASFNQAKVTRLEKDVKILKANAAPHAAVVGENITAVTSVATGVNSRAELRFPDNSLTRLGANSRFTLRGQGHTVELDKGVLLLEVPEKLRDAKVRTAAVTAAVTGGTAIVEYLPGGFVKLMVVEGKVDMFLTEDPSQFITLNAGEMIIQPANATTMSSKVTFDLKLLLKTSKLINPDSEPNAKEIYQALNQQQEEINDGDLVKTNLVIPGLGTVVQLTNDARFDVIPNFGLRDSTPGAPQGGTDNSNNNAAPPGPPFPGVVPLITGITVLNANSYVKTDPKVTAFNVATGTMLTSDGSIYRPATDGPFPYFTFGSTQPADSDLTSLLQSKDQWATYKFEELLVNGTPGFDLPGTYIGDEATGQFASFSLEVPENYNPIPNVVFAALGAISLAADNQFSTGEGSPGASTGNLLDTTDIALESLVLYSQNGNITLAENFQIQAYEQDYALVTAGAASNITLSGDVSIYNGSLLVSAGQDLLVENNTQAGDIVFRAGRDATLKGGGEGSQRAIQASGEKLLVSARRNIKVTDSAQLLLLTEFSADALLRLESLEGEIVIDGKSNLDGSNVEIEAFKGNVSILDSTVTAAHALKVQTLRPDGTLLIRGSNLTGGPSAANLKDLIRLYANGSNGTVQFQGLVTLDSDEVQIAGKTVKVDAGGVVTITKNNVHIFADNRLYNKNNDGSSPGNGTINSTFIKDDYGFNHTDKPDFKNGGKLGRNLP